MKHLPLIVCLLLCGCAGAPPQVQQATGKAIVRVTETGFSLLDILLGRVRAEAKRIELRDEEGLRK